MAIKRIPAPRNPKTAHRYGWVPDLPDYRDLTYASERLALEAPQALPSSIDLSPEFPPPYDQGQLGSCTANAIGGAFQYEQIRQNIPNWIPSRLFIYYNERAIEGTVSTDSGAQIRDGIKSVATQGAPPETDWPYNIAAFAEKPPASAYQDAKLNEATSYLRLDNRNLNELKTCLAAKFPFVFGITVYSSFESPQANATGVIPMPQFGDSILGGHAIVAVGYDDTTGLFRFRNSWGTGWGKGGYGFIPYQYLTNKRLARDFWTIRTVT